jgi:hypothetical protein
MTSGNSTHAMYRFKQILHILPFFVLTAIYLWLVVEPRLIFNSFGSILSEAPPFLTGARALKDTLSLPGGFVMYLSGFLSQGLTSSGLGAALIASVGFCLYDLCRRHLGTARQGSTVAATVCPIALFLIYSRYEHPLPESLAVCLGLLCSLFFEKLPLRNPWLRLAGYGLMAAFVYWLLGAGGLLVFSLMTCVYGLVQGKWLCSVLLWGVAGIIVWLSAQILFLIPPQQAFLGLTPFSPGVTEGMRPVSRALISLMVGWVPVFMVIQFLVARRPHKTHPPKNKAKSRPGRTKKAKSPRPSWWCSLACLKQLACLSVPFVLLGTGLYADSNPMRKPFVQAHDYARHRQWDKMLDLGRHLPKGQSNVFVSHGIIRALYQTGRLPYDLFQFPQMPHGLLLTHETTDSFLTQLTLCDLFMEMGQVNMAERLASEFLAVKGHNGTALEYLAWIDVYKGQYETARVHLRALQKDLVYRAAADSLLTDLDRGFQPDQLARIEKIRSNMCQDPGVVANMASPETILLSALQFNPKNKMAFEYLMASYLLTGQIDKIVTHAGHLKDLGYESIPTLYEEAILIHAGMNGRTLDLDRFNVRPATIDRYRQFAELKNTMTARNQTAVLNRLIKEFGQSYLFYFAFGRVGLT